MASGDELLAAIRLRAYFLWEKAGRPDGGDIAFWDEARRQIDQERAGATEREASGDQVA